ncbi:hypothetical protein SAMN07250955_101522 [Arboricoccus pini]|uniref:Cell division protein FtsL n=1 Tax=Arboricoccus pini TaxID=1963835 RepID=A0A212Q9X1_9PROT|nr:hypothetical protein [Arboricoccus pini]SNB56153.1 hypothetical protein SAMN07250955_101522 [Arboricoccus pini]
MSWRLTIFTGMAALACAVVVFEFKGTVRTIDRQIVSTSREIEQQKWRLQTLRADYAYLTRPERLAMQAAQLGMVPASTKAMTQISAIALDSQVAFADRAVPVTLPGGETVELRFKPASVGYVARDAGAIGQEDAPPASAESSSTQAPPAQPEREQVASATPSKLVPASAKAESSASSRAAEAAKATKAAQAALAARIAQATARRSATTVAPQKSSPAPMWAGSPPRQNNLP